MKTFYRIISCLAIVFASLSCSRIDAEIDALKERMSALEQRVESLNSELNELSSLVQQIQIGNYVTAVIKDQEGNGYILAFSDGSSVHLDIPDDVQEEVPQIGVQQDSDGVWYWTLGGEWLLNASGNRVRASSPSQPRPQIKMEEDEWFISYDGGSTWEIIITKSSTGTSGIFSSVDTSDPDCVVITLSDGTQLLLPTWAAFDSLRQEVKRLNINLASLSRIVSALQDYDYLVSTTPFVEEGVPVGWLLNFSKSGLVVIYSSTGGSSPQVGVRRDSDGVYYWTLGGEWLLDAEGKMVRAQGSDGKDATAPKLKIEGGDWYVSYDDGETWERLGRASGEDGDSFFQEVDVSSDEFVRLVMSDGSSLKIPKFIPLDLILDLPRDLVLDQWEGIHIPYRIVGAQGKETSLSVLVNGSISAGIFPGVDPMYNPDENAGFIGVSSETPTPSGTVVAILSTNNGVSVVRSFNISPREVYVGDSRDKMSLFGHYVANAPTEGGIVSFLYQSNSSFNLDVSDVPWVEVIEAYSGPQGEIVLKVDPSEGAARSGDIIFNYDDETWSGYRTRDSILCPPFYFSVTQSAGSLDMDRSNILAIRNSFTYSLEMRTKINDLRVELRDHSEWLKTWVVRESEGKYTLYAELAENNSGKERRETIDVMNNAGGQLLGCVDVLQKPYDDLSDQGMVFKVIAEPENDYTVCLPFTGNMHIDVYWGDSNVSLIDREDGSRDYPVRHKYQSCDGSREFKVKAFGSAKAMTNSEEIEPYVTVKSVDSWGYNLALEDMTDAFKNCTTLTKIGDAGPFYNVRSFAGAFEGCTNLTYVPVDLFCAAYRADNYTHTFYGVGSVLSESPYLPVDDRKVHLYERDTEVWWEWRHFYPVKNHEGCFYGGNWADQEAIHLAGWD